MMAKEVAMTNKEAAIVVVKRLSESGFEALFAGGCVRDMLLGREAKDHDVATNATPDEIMGLFRRTLAIGAKFGVVMVLLDSQQVEVATFRTEGGYADGRHPDAVVFSNAKEDARRRDFTINGMFYDPIAKKVYDYVDGEADIGRKVLRTIGDAEKRFAEDYLRMLRAVRFSVQLGFEIEAKTWQAVCSGAGNISKISGERIAMELEAILSCAGRGCGVELLCESGLGGAIFGGQMCAIGLKVVSNLPVDAGFILSLACLFSGVECDVAMEKCEILMLSNSQSRVLQFLLENKGVLLDGSMRLAELKLLLASGYFEELLAFERAIGKASGPCGDGVEVTACRAKELAGTDIAPKPLLDGYELMELGVEEGPKLGVASREMYLLQLDGELVDKEGAREWVKGRLSPEE